MKKFKLQTKQMKVLVIAMTAVFILLGTILYYLYFLLETKEEESVAVPKENEKTYEYVITKNKSGSTVVWDSLPDDVDWEEILPMLPPTVKLNSVVDNRQIDSRMVFLQYSVNRNKDRISSMILDDMQTKGWTLKRQEEDYLNFVLDNQNIIVGLYSVEENETDIDIILKIHKA